MKKTKNAAAVLSAGIEAREWNGCAIQRRQADDFVNATAMCRAGGKRWDNYARNNRTREYIHALAASTGAQIPGAAAVARNRATGIEGLITVVQGGRPELQGTWVHPRLAVDLARWISPSFAVWMDGWLLGVMGLVEAQQPEQPGIHSTRPQQARGLQDDPLKPMASRLPALVAQRWQGDPDANGIIRAIAHHLLLSCDPLPAVAVVDGAARAWSRALASRTGGYGWGVHW